MKSACSFLCLLKETNKQRSGEERAPGVPCPAVGGMSCAPQCCRGFANSAFASNSANPFSAASSVLGGVPMGIFSSPSPFVLPRLADGGGKDAGGKRRLRLFEGEARVFPRSALVEK